MILKKSTVLDACSTTRKHLQYIWCIFIRIKLCPKPKKHQNQNSILPGPPTTVQCLSAEHWPVLLILNKGVKYFYYLSKIDKMHMYLQFVIVNIFNKCESVALILYKESTYIMYTFSWLIRQLPFSILYIFNEWWHNRMQRFYNSNSFLNVLKTD